MIAVTIRTRVFPVGVTTWSHLNYYLFLLKLISGCWTKKHLVNRSASKSDILLRVSSQLPGTLQDSSKLSQTTVIQHFTWKWSFIYPQKNASAKCMVTCKPLPFLDIESFCLLDNPVLWHTRPIKVTPTWRSRFIPLNWDTHSVSLVCKRAWKGAKITAENCFN